MEEWIEKILRETGYTGNEGKLDKFGTVVERFKQAGATGHIVIPRAVGLAALEHDSQILAFIHEEVEKIEQSALTQLKLMNAPDSIMQLIQQLIVLASVLESRNTTPHLVLKKALKE